MGLGKTKKQYRLKASPEKARMIGRLGGLRNMTFKDLQRQAIMLGMPFPEVPQSDFFRLESFILNSPNEPDKTLIDKYDDWMDKVLEERGYSKDDPMRNYQLRLGFVSEDAVTKQKKFKRVKGIPKPKKPKRETDERGLWKGTKKSYTFELTARGYDLERVIRRVQKKFPEAKDKSIKQWWRAAKRKVDGEKEI